MDRGFSVLAVIALVTVALPVSAHPGGLDSQGCHTNRRTGDYHCHARSGSAGTSTASSKPNFRNDAEISGVASVIDGDTIEIRGTRIRLHGIDAPESAQTCRTSAGQVYRCGQLAALKLSDFINRRPVVCHSRDTDRYGRMVAVCRVAGVDMNEWLVREGLAVAFRRYSADYVSAEHDAKADKRGIWAGTFELPSDFRRKMRE